MQPLKAIIFNQYLIKALINTKTEINIKTRLKPTAFEFLHSKQVQYFKIKLKPLSITCKKETHSFFCCCKPTLDSFFFFPNRLALFLSYLFYLITDGKEIIPALPKPTPMQNIIKELLTGTFVLNVKKVQELWPLRAGQFLKNTLSLFVEANGTK